MGLLRGLFLGFCSFVSGCQLLNASHVLGGEITYKKGTGNNYIFQLSVYRNCSECEFNTLNCPNIPDLDIIGAPGTPKAGQKLGTVSLTRTERKDITPVCPSVTSACSSRPGINTGIENWVFSGTHDFTSLLSSQCRFHIAVRIDSRTDAWGTPEYFYNFAALDLCNNLTNNSAQFKAPAFYLLAENEPFRYNPLAHDADGDSLSYRLVTAQKGFERNLIYPAGYTAMKPLSVFCGSGGGCPDDPKANPPTGLVFDSLSGDLTFTPMVTGSRGFMVLQVLEWRSIGGVMVQVGEVRRDLQFLVLSVKNSAPALKIVGAQDWLCAGDETCLEVYATDPAYFGVKDSLVLDVDATVAGYDFRIIQSKAGSADASLCWTPSGDSMFNGAERITFRVRDQSCPLNLYAYASHQFRVAEKVKAGISMSLDTCGTIKATAKATPLRTGNNYDWFLFKDGNQLVNQASGKDVNFRLKSGGKYMLRLELKNAVTGCMSVAEDSLLVPDFIRPSLKLNFPQQLCPGAASTVLARIQGGTRPFRYLWKGEPGDSLVFVSMPQHPLQSLSLPLNFSDRFGCSLKAQVLIQPYPYRVIGFRDTAICSSSAPLVLNHLTAAGLPALSYKLLKGNAALVSLPPDLLLRHDGRSGVNRIEASYSDQFGCMRRDTALIEVTDLPDHGITALPAICQGTEFIDLRRESGLRLSDGSWFHQAQLLRGDTLQTAELSPGTYALRYFWRGWGCIIDKTLELRVLPKPTIQLNDALPRVLCGSNNTELTLLAYPSGGQWFGEYVSGSVLRLPAGKAHYKSVYYYQDPVTQCSDTLEYRVEAVMPPQFRNLEGYVPELCAGESIRLRVGTDRGEAVDFSSSEEDELSVTRGTETRFMPGRSSGLSYIGLKAASGNVCPDADTTLYVRVKPLPEAQINYNSSRGCAPFESLIRLSGFSAGTLDACSWEPSDNIGSLGDFTYRFSSADSGVFPLKVKLFRDGCSRVLNIRDTFRVFSVPKADFDVLPGTIVDWEYPGITLHNLTICRDSWSSLWDISGDTAWQTNSRNPVLKFPAPGVYQVRLRSTNIHGCSDEVSREVKVNPPLRYFVPNAFTPDGKMPEENNEFKVTLKEEVAEFNLQVFNRWGQKIFESAKVSEGWNGKNPDGSLCQAGGYAWSMRLRTAAGREVVQQGVVLLLR